MTAPEVRRLLGISGPTLYRYVKQGVLPRPEYQCGRRVWQDEDVLALRQRRLAAPRREFPKADYGRRLFYDARELRGAAGDALTFAGVTQVAEVLRRYGADALSDVRPQRRRACAFELRGLARAHEGRAA